MALLGLYPRIRGRILIRIGWDDWDKLNHQTCPVDPSRSLDMPLRIPVCLAGVVRLVRRIRGGGRWFPRHRARVDDELVAVGGENGERDPERDGTLGAVLVAGADQGDDGHPAIIGEAEEPGLVLHRRADQDAVPVAGLPQAESRVEVADGAPRD